MFECVVCGAQARRWVTLAILGEFVAICGERCRERFIHDPISYLGTFMGAAEGDGSDR